MKKAIIAGIAVMSVVSLLSLVWAQEKVKPEQGNPPATEKLTPAKQSEVNQEKAKAESPKPRERRAGGIVKEVDLKKHILTIHQETVKHDRDIKMKVTKDAAKELPNLKSGDLVNIWIQGQIVTGVSVLR